MSRILARRGQFQSHFIKEPSPQRLKSSSPDRNEAVKVSLNGFVTNVAVSAAAAAGVFRR